METNRVEKSDTNLECIDIFLVNGWIVFLLLLFPLICCIVDKYIFDFSIEGIILCYWLVATLTMIGGVFFMAGIVLGPFLGFIVAVILGSFFGMLFMNYFMLIASLFGVMNYNIMYI